MLKINNKNKQQKKPTKTKHSLAAATKAQPQPTKNPYPTNQWTKKKKKDHIQANANPKIAVCFVLGVLLEGTVSTLFQKYKTFCAYTLQDTGVMSHSVEVVRFSTDTEQGQKTGHGLLCRPDGRSSCFGEVCLLLDVVHLCIFRGMDLGDFSVWTIYKLVFKLKLEHKFNKLGEWTQQKQSAKHHSTKGSLSWNNLQAASSCTSWALSFLWCLYSTLQNKANILSVSLFELKCKLSGVVSYGINVFKIQ